MTKKERATIDLARLLIQDLAMDFDDAMEKAREAVGLAARYTRLQEKSCSDPSYGPRDEGRERALEKRIAELFEGLKVHFSGDPRGYCVKVEFPSGRSNHWGGANWGIG